MAKDIKTGARRKARVRRAVAASSKASSGGANRANYSFRPPAHDDRASALIRPAEDERPRQESNLRPTL